MCVCFDWTRRELGRCVYIRVACTGFMYVCDDNEEYVCVSASVCVCVCVCVYLQTTAPTTGVHARGGIRE